MVSIGRLSLFLVLSITAIVSSLLGYEISRVSFSGLYWKTNIEFLSDIGFLELDPIATRAPLLIFGLRERLDNYGDHSVFT